MENTLASNGDPAVEQAEAESTTPALSHPDYAHRGDGDISKCPVAHLIS
jgi:hypothetical protein